MDSKKVKFFSTLVLILLFLPLSIRLYGAYDSLGVQRRIYHCLDFIEDGALYGGQPYCPQPPATYFLTYFIIKFIGESFIPLSFVFLNTVLNILLFLLIYRIIDCETGYKNYPLILVAYLMWVYTASINNPDAMLSAYYLLVGFYVLFYSNIRFKHALAGIFFSLSALSKMISAPLIPLILAYYLIKNGVLKVNIIHGKASFSFDSPYLKHSLKILLPMLLSFSAVILAYPDFMSYTFTAQLLQKPLIQHRSLTDAFYSLLPADANGLRSNIFTSELALIISLITFVRWRSGYAVLSAVGISIFLYHQTWVIGEIFLSRHGLPAYPFFIITLFKLKSEMKRHSLQNVLFTLIFALLILGNNLGSDQYRLGYYEIQRWSMQDLVEKPLAMTPPQENLLMEFTPSRGVLPIDMPLGRRTQVWDKYYDGYWAPILVDLGVVNNLQTWQPNTERITLREHKIVERIESGDYDVIVYGPQNWQRMLYLLSVVNRSAYYDYCTVHVPNLDYFSFGGRHHTTMKFRNQSHCNHMLNLLEEYYASNFEEICRRDKFTANNVVNVVLGMNDINPKMKCESGGQLLSYYNIYRNRFSPPDILAMSVAFLLIVLGFYPSLSKSLLSGSSVQSFIYAEAIIVLIVVIISGVYYGQSPLSRPWYNENATISQPEDSEIPENALRFDDFVYGVRKDDREGTPKVSELKWEYFYMPLSLNTSSTEVFFNGYFTMQDPDVIVTAKDCVTELYVNEMLVSENPECTACRDCSGFQLDLRNYTRPGWNLIAGKIINQGDEVFFHVEAN